MRIFCCLTVLVFSIGMLAGCGEFRPIGPDYHYIRHTVQAGDTLYSIAWRFGYDYRELAAWNGIPPPYRIRIGEEILILAPGRYGPVVTPRAAPPATATSPPPATQKPLPTATGPAKGSPATSLPPAAPPVRVKTDVRWSWPTQGKLLGRYAAGTGRKGIDVGGRAGQPIKAAADGEVVYSGSGLIGYGNLVIIKHDDVFLSAYGHNRRLLVKEGDKTKAGQIIGEMGQHPKSGSILHFEIRRNGKPVDPLLYLPNQTS